LIRCRGWSPEVFDPFTITEDEARIASSVTVRDCLTVPAMAAHGALRRDRCAAA
jgi:hypothetical protein